MGEESRASPNATPRAVFGKWRKPRRTFAPAAGASLARGEKRSARGSGGDVPVSWRMMDASKDSPISRAAKWKDSPQPYS
jgi:hypothetical protein